MNFDYEMGHAFEHVGITDDCVPITACKRCGYTRISLSPLAACSGAPSVPSDAEVRQRILRGEDPWDFDPLALGCAAPLDDLRARCSSTESTQQEDWGDE